MIDVLKTWIATDIMAGLSAVLTWWFAIATVVMGALCVRQRYRFLHGWKVSARERADACLNLALYCVFLHSTYHRAMATYSFALQEWKVTTASAVTAPVYLPIAMFGMSLFLWWCGYELHGLQRRWWWCLWMWSGLALFGVVVLAF